MRKKFFLWLFIASSIGLFIFAYIVLKPNNSYTPQQNLAAPIEITSENILPFTEAQKSDKAIAAMFYVDWCTYCRQLMPVFEKLAKQYQNKYTFTVINCDDIENRTLVNSFHIMAFPSLFIIDNKYNHKFSMNFAASTDESIMKEELDSYLKVRENLKK